jgi:hypothetical protein
MPDRKHVETLLTAWSAWMHAGRKDPEPDVEHIDRLIQKLGFPHRCIVKRHTLGTHTLRDLAAVFDCSHTKISRVYGDGVRELAKGLSAT